MKKQGLLNTKIAFTILSTCVFISFCTISASAQTEIKNTSSLTNEVIRQKIAFIDSVHKLNKVKAEKEQKDGIYYKTLLELGNSREYIEDLRKKNDPSYTNPFRTKNLTTPVILTTGPEQNCDNAIAVCQSTYIQSNSYTGFGYQEVYGTCMLAKEQSTVWYVFTVQTAGTLGFDLTTLHDYDYALYDLTSIGGCSQVPGSTPIRCNFSGTYGNTGLSSSSTSPYTTPISVPASGSPYENGITNPPVGETYALVIDNYTLDAVGYTITFTGTATIFDNTAPTLSSAASNCNGTVTLTLSEQVKCSSIRTSAAYDFTISGPAAMSITSETGIGCTTANITNQITLGISSPAVSGTYTITAQIGGDGNTLLDKCANAMSTSQTITFNYLAPITISAAPSSTLCTGSSATLTASGGASGTTYAWSPSGGSSSTQVVSPLSTTTYIATVTYGGCTTNATKLITMTSSPVIAISPMNPILCSGTQVLTATSCTGCTYQWSGGYSGTSNPTPAQGAGTYSCVATSSVCGVSNTATTTISLASSASTACNLFYVKTAATGTGDGLTPANATTIDDALTLASCAGANIKMAVGTYSITNTLSIGSGVTIEGGFNSTFTTKTSDMSGGANSTTIRRSDDPDGGSGTDVSAFTVAGSSSNFRFQDLRIEMPGASTSPYTNTAGSQQTNYGINLGAGCSNYRIVRCYIDAGAGAD